MSNSLTNRGVKPQTKEFQTITKTRKLLVHYCKATSKAPKEYHRDLCRDVKFLIKDALHLLRGANEVDIYDNKRLEKQLKGYEYLKQANDLLPALEDLGAEVLSINSCSALKLELQSILGHVDGWINSDRERVKESLRKRRKRAGYDYQQAKIRYDKILVYYQMLPEEERVKGELDLVRCFDEAYSDMEVLKKAYIEANKAYVAEIEFIKKRQEDKQRRMGQKIYHETPPMVLEKTIDALLESKKSTDEIFKEISRKRLYEEKDKRLKYDERLQQKMEKKEKDFRDKTLKKFGLEGEKK